MTSKLAHALIKVIRIMLNKLISKLTKSSLIIHRKVTCGHFGIKWGQEMMKFIMGTNFGMENSFMTIIFEIDQIFINYS